MRIGAGLGKKISKEVLIVHKIALNLVPITFKPLIMITQRLLVRLVLPLCLLFVSHTLLAQKSISGKVTDQKDGSPIVGASVQAKSAGTGTSTGNDGSFTLSVPNDVTTLIISYVGYGTVELSIAGKTTLDVTLSATSALNLNEVVVVGYGTARKKI